MPLGNPNAYGQTVIDPRAELLLGRAMRPEPIQSGVGLLGRLAALGVGLQGQRRFEDEIAASRLQFAQGLSAAGADPSARIAVLASAMNSRDPGTRTIAAAQLAQEMAAMRPKSQIVAGPDGSQYVVPLMGEQVAGEPTQLIEGRTPAPETRTRTQGELQVTEQWDPARGDWSVVSTAPRTAAQIPLPPDVYQQQLELRTATGAAQGAATAAGLAATMEKSAAQAEGAATGSLEGKIEGIRPYFASTEANLLATGAALQANPTSAEARTAYEIARDEYANAATMLGAPNEAVTDDSKRGKLDRIPDATAVAGYGLVKSDPLGAAVESVRKGLGDRAPPRTRQPSQPPAPGGMTPAQLRRMAELLEKAEADAANAR